MKAFLGIDVSKGYADFILLDSSLNQLDSHLQLDDTCEGHDALFQWLQDTKNAYNLSEIYAAVESTGGFENNWFALLKNLGKQFPIKVSRLNPSVVKNAALADLKGQVTDAISASNIAKYLIRFSDKVDYKQIDSQYRSFRSLDNHIQLLSRQKTQMINELKQLLYTCFPELQRFCKQSIPVWVLNLLIKFPTSNDLSHATIAKVTKIKSISSGKAQKLIERAKSSTSSRGTHTDGYLISSIAEDLLAKQKRIDELKKLLCEKCTGNEVTLIQSIVGIGAYSAARIMIQIEHIERFQSPSHLAGYFGLYPTLKQSGDKLYVSRMSKKGRSAIRNALFMCANTAVLHDSHMRSIYHKSRAKSMSHKQAIGVVMHKMLRIIWGILSSGKPYTPEIDIQNIQNDKIQNRSKTQNEVKIKRRLQEYDENAPISRRAFKKRKAHQTSQVSKTDQVRDLVDAP